MKNPNEQSTNKPSAQLTSLVEEYPDLATGLHQFLADEEDSVVASVGIFTLLQLRLRSVLAHLPQTAPPETTPPSASQPNPAIDGQ